MQWFLRLLSVAQAHAIVVVVAVVGVIAMVRKVVVVCFTYFEGFNTHLRAHNDLKDHDVDVSDDNIATRTKLGFDF